MSEERMVSKVNDLIGKNNDAAKGFKEAADHAESQKLKSLLTKQADERETFAEELSIKLRAYHPDADTDDDGRAAGAIHRGWLNVKAALSMNDDEAILKECIRGDKKAKEEYEEALSDFSGLSNEVINLISDQKKELEKTLSKLKSLEDLK